MTFDEILDCLVLEGQYKHLTATDVCNKMVDLYGYNNAFMDDLLCAALGNEEAIKIIEGYVYETLEIMMTEGE